MYYNEIAGASIRGIECACPTEVFENAEYGKLFGEKAIQKTIRMTGIERFRVCRPEQTASDLCYAAAEKLLDRLGWDRDEVGAVLFVSNTPDYRSPSTAFVLQGRLGLGSSCVAFDMNLGCTGYVVGLQTLASILSGSNKTKGLLLCGITASKCYDRSEKASAVLFGDAGSATALELDGAGLFSCATMSRGESFRSIWVPDGSFRYFGAHPNWRDELKDDGCLALGSSHMNGDEVFQFVMTDAKNLIEEYFEHTATTSGDYDWFVFHQAQKFILDHLAVFAGIPAEKVLTSYRDFGNTTVASIPLTLCSNRSALGDGPVRIFASGFGVGLQASVLTTRIEKSAIGGITFTDEYFPE